MIILKFQFNKLINYQKGSFDNIINNNNYLCGRNIRLEIDQQKIIIESASG